jgi:hypothetical protein
MRPEETLSRHCWADLENDFCDCEVATIPFEIIVRAEGFFVQQAGFFPEGPLGGEDTNRECTLRYQLREALSEIRLNGAFRVWPVIGARASSILTTGLI